MRIIIEPTDDQSMHKYKNHAVQIVSETDDINIRRAAEMIGSALLAWGFSETLVEKIMPDWRDYLE